MPLEYCEYSGKPDKCRQWQEKNLPDEIEKLQIVNDDEVADAEKKHQKRGGKVSVFTSNSNIDYFKPKTRRFLAKLFFRGRKLLVKKVLLRRKKLVAHQRLLYKEH